MRDFLLMRLAAIACAVLGAGLLLVVLLDLLPRGAIFDAAAWSTAITSLTNSEAWGRLAVTVPLVLIALLVASTGLALGAFAALSQWRWLHRLLDGIAATLALIPPFWLGLLLSISIGGTLHWLPASGFAPWENPTGALLSLILPALALGLPQAGALAVATRKVYGTPPTNLPAPEARREQSRLGLHGLRTALPGLLGTAFATLLVSAILVETVFYLPGLGRLILSAALEHDLIVLASSLFALTLAAALGLLLLSLVRAAVDPELHG